MIHDTRTYDTHARAHARMAHRSTPHVTPHGTRKDKLVERRFEVSWISTNDLSTSPHRAAPSCICSMALPLFAGNGPVSPKRNGATGDRGAAPPAPEDGPPAVELYLYLPPASPALARLAGLYTYVIYLNAPTVRKLFTFFAATLPRPRASCATNEQRPQQGQHPAFAV